MLLIAIAFSIFIHSLLNNSIGPEGAAAITLAMEKMTNLQTFKYFLYMHVFFIHACIYIVSRASPL